jgi:nucleotidyltransferase substrate binding protein (TIGR01987 family)
MVADVRWMQRFNNYLQAFGELQDGVVLANERSLSKLEKQGLIQGFEYTHELAWNLMKDFLVEQGFNNLIGSKDTTRQAFKSGIVSDGEIWMDMIKSRNLTSHTYDESLAEEVVTSIIEKYYSVMKKLAETFSSLHDQEKE